MLETKHMDLSLVFEFESLLKQTVAHFVCTESGSLAAVCNLSAVTTVALKYCQLQYFSH